MIDRQTDFGFLNCFNEKKIETFKQQKQEEGRRTKPSTLKPETTTDNKRPRRPHQHRSFSPKSNIISNRRHF